MSDKLSITSASYRLRAESARANVVSSLDTFKHNIVSSCEADTALALEHYKAGNYAELFTNPLGVPFINDVLHEPNIRSKFVSAIQKSHVYLGFPQNVYYGQTFRYGRVAFGILEQSLENIDTFTFTRMNGQTFNWFHVRGHKGPFPLFESTHKDLNTMIFTLEEIFTFCENEINSFPYVQFKKEKL